MYSNIYTNRLLIRMYTCMRRLEQHRYQPVTSLPSDRSSSFSPGKSREPSFGIRIQLFIDGDRVTKCGYVFVYSLSSHYRPYSPRSDHLLSSRFGEFFVAHANCCGFEYHLFLFQTAYTCWMYGISVEQCTYSSVYMLIYIAVVYIYGAV